MLYFGHYIYMLSSLYIWFSRKYKDRKYSYETREKKIDFISDIMRFGE